MHPEVLRVYQALYRKYRPRCFSDVTGQEHITETLRQQMILGKLSHAYLFVGSRGTGKTTCAKILSCAANCLDPANGDACGKCASCVGIENGSILDVLELDAASNNGVDNIRALREEAVYTPALVKKRVYIVDEVHMLSSSAFNALLKILEEPPEHLIFILATTELHKVPATIMSRCQRFMFKRIQQDAIIARLNDIASKEGFTLTADAAEKLAALADGSMRDAISLFDQCATGSTVDLACVRDTIGLAGHQEIISIAGAVAKRDITSLLEMLDNMYQDGRDMVSLLNELSALMRNLLVYKLSPNSPLIGTNCSLSELSALSKKLPPERLFYTLEMIREALYGISRGGAVKLTTEMCLIKICSEGLSDETSALLSRIKKLEEQSVAQVASDLGNKTVESVKAAQPKLSAAAAEPEASEAPEAQTARETQTAQEAQTAREAPKTPDVQKAQETPAASEDTESVAHHISSPELQDGNIAAEYEQTESASGISNEAIDISSQYEESDFWQKIVGLLVNVPHVYSVVGDSLKVWGEMRDGFIIINADDMFTVNQISTDMFLASIKDSARKVLDREVPIRVEFCVSNERKMRSPDKLDPLRAIGNVQFE